MKGVLYGLPCAGKTTLFGTLKGWRTVNGSEQLNRLCGGKFSAASEEEQRAARIAYLAYLDLLAEKNILSDGHYAFPGEVVFTEGDATEYDAYFYLYCPLEQLAERLRASEKNGRFAALSPARLAAWQEYEIEALRASCHKHKRDFYVLDGGTAEEVQRFFDAVAGGWSPLRLAEEIVAKIVERYPVPCAIRLADGDKTLITEDSLRVCADCRTSVFDGNFYTGYPAFRFGEELPRLAVDREKIALLKADEALVRTLKEGAYAVLSSGITSLWEEIGGRLGLENVFADPRVCADTKYFVARMLRERGYRVSAYGDGKLDLYMLQEGEEGTLIARGRLSRSLKGADIGGVKFSYDRSSVILAEKYPDEVGEDIRICKSDSGINGGALAAAHFRLGQRLGEEIAQLFPPKNTAVLVLERGGRFFGDGLYTRFGGTFYTCHSVEDLPEIEQRFVILTDSVINTGRSVARIAETLRARDPKKEIVLAANVVQRGALELFRGCKLYTVRVSDNSFVGANVAVQHGSRGPDTADRLFNLIKSEM